ncbi:serine/threonine protein kinase, CMGC, dual-specificity [Vermiconidia calcicola]|uniref:Serine/threonine protein kinase, CMGC, dual-specificity n=1 Tax=Vermiconidia calcicola TaxID=1690605 RepID=A0ACC3MPR0_9PEZI|nr:serine/threonine protein kinase, CMGC, dual-specificity [Vermiconidia calcicola]
MDVATRYQPRQRTASYRDMDGNTLPEDSSGESESNPVRRKFQRTTTDPEGTTSATQQGFRKPSLPASATRAAGVEHRPSFSQRRKSNFRGENVRVPSGPREYPTSPGKQRIGSTPSTAPSVSDATNTGGSGNPPARPFLPPSNSDSFFYNSRLANSSHTRVDSFGRSGTNPYTTNATATENLMQTPGQRGGVLGESLDFSVNFDDFQTSIKNYDGSSPLLSDFPAVDGGRIIPREDHGMARGGVKDQRQQQQLKNEDEGLGRTQSLRQRLAGGRQGQKTSGQDMSAAAPTQAAASNLSLRDRRQSSMTQAASGSAAPAAKPPRKYVGPGLISSMIKGGFSQQQQSAAPMDSAPKPALARNSSLTKARRTTIQPATGPGAELPRISTLTATTQSRQNKVKSLQPPARDQSQLEQPNTPRSAPSKRDQQNHRDRAHTPSSSGTGKRQSIATSGRASGLGARTVSPTDARRLKRMSMAPPMPMPPTNNNNYPMPVSHTSTAQEETPNPMANNAVPMPELPRFAQPSPSFIPRKSSSATPSSSSARASPDGGGKQNQGQNWLAGGGVSLSSKSSYQSLVSNGRPSSLNGSSSRLPTPKPRHANQSQSNSAMGQYGEESEQEELVPPVPAIPKAYESPKDLDPPPFFSSLKSSQSGRSEDRGELPAPKFAPTTPRGSLDQVRGGRERTGTNDTSAAAPLPVPAPSAPPKTTRAQHDPNGRKNSNLQPLHLPPMNLMPFNNTRTSQYNNLPHPSQELDTRSDRDEYTLAATTPEPKRNTKTPSTPMTAGKATFFSRHRQQQDLRSSSSHYALRDVMGMDAAGNLTTKFNWDDSDVESTGMPIPGGAAGRQQQQQQPRSAITPFASGSLPKGSGEFARHAAQGLRTRPSGEYNRSNGNTGLGGGIGGVGAAAEDEYTFGASYPEHLSKPRTRAQTNASGKSGLSLETSAAAMTGMEDPASATESAKRQSQEKKESTGAGLRRKLSLGWRRSSSKAANHAENGSKSSPPQQQENSGMDERVRARLQKRSAGDNGRANEMMPPPKLPASATWSGDVPSLPSSTRASFDTNAQGLHHVRRKSSQVPTSMSSVNLADEQQQQPVTGGIKTRAQHAEQPTPVTSRSSSWSTLRPGANRHKPNTSCSTGFSVLNKDKDDLAADDEMHRLSRKRKDVDFAARETEDLKKRAVARSPLSAEQVLHDRASGLNVFERGEVVDFERDGVYFTGTRGARKIVGSLSPTSATSKPADAAAGNNNFGYDDERGDYNIVLGDHLAYRYEVVDVLGKGSFGQVVRCVDHKEGGIVAVKIIRNKKRFHQQALVEVGILGRLREWDPDSAHATLSITTSFYFRSHLCIVTPCLSINLYELIRAHNFTGFPLPLIRRFARQLLACLTLLQHKHIIHCDLKPENILLCEARKADVRVIDFGSSCREEEKVYTYIQSRFYRSPEVILGSSYGLGIDMWSLGCILAEVWTGYPLFPGENEQEQLACIMEIFGPPDRHLVERCTRKKLFFDSVGKPRVTVSSKGRRRRPSSRTLQQALKTEDEAFVDFVARCLRWDPDRRLKASDAVTHPFVLNLKMGMQQEDARRGGARVRSTVAVSAQQGVPSPVKRGAAASSGNAFAMQTPVKERNVRPLPETPQTALRNGVPPSSMTTHGSPIKSSANNNRRHSAVVNAAAVAGSKRASNGAVLGASATPAGLSLQQQQQQQRVASGNMNASASAASLAQMAARESMGAAGAGAGSRWRT